MPPSLRERVRPFLTLDDNPLTLDDMTVIRSAGLRGFRATVTALGGDPERYAEAALARLADGTFGRCERCSARIGEARLEARPTARLCIDCAS